ncbi:MAG TPA: FmdB family zinc ribbon protein [Opitutaceae bacterium]|nr:FmdB family zinc ribbon protein [Opitutaceae bacterium]
MPTYEYICQNCGERFEVFQSMKDSPLRTCPRCKKRRVKRLVGRGAGVIFKGSGFYETDYRRSPAKAGGGKPKSESAATPESAPTGAAAVPPAKK